MTSQTFLCHPSTINYSDSHVKAGWKWKLWPNWGKFKVFLQITKKLCRCNHMQDYQSQNCSWLFKFTQRNKQQSASWYCFWLVCSSQRLNDEPREAVSGDANNNENCFFSSVCFRSFLPCSDEHLMLLDVCVVFIVSSACNFVYFVSFIIKHEILLLLCCLFFLPGFLFFFFLGISGETHSDLILLILWKELKANKQDKNLRSHWVRETFYRKSFESFWDKLSPPGKSLSETTKVYAIFTGSHR